jgi:hypothetical protein
MNQQNCGASTLPPIIITISCVSLISGSKPRLPPGELSNMKPKSGTGMNTTDTNNFKLTTHKPLFINIRDNQKVKAKTFNCFNL